MRDVYPSFLGRTDEELARFVKDATIVVDTNVLLDLYRIDPKAREEALGVLEAPGVAQRLWMPHQVGVEFLRRRGGVAKGLDDAYSKASRAIEELKRNATTGFGDGRRHKSSREKVKELVDKAVTDLLGELDRVKSVDKARLDLEHDRLLGRITHLFAGKVGTAPPTDVIRTRVDEFDTFRAPNQIPPGYKDLKKEGIGRAGDYLIWCEILDHASKGNQPLLFVTEDRKDDWFEGGSSTKTGPRHELVAEFAERNHHGYHQLGFDRFLSLAGKYLRVTLDESTITEVAETARADHQERMQYLRRRLRRAARRSGWDRLIDRVNDDVDEQTLLSMIDALEQQANRPDQPFIFNLLKSLESSGTSNDNRSTSDEA